MELVILLVILQTVAANYPPVQTLIYSQIDRILNHDNHTNPALIPCLEVANEFVLGGIFVDELKEAGNAKFPAPSGAMNWTVEELTNAANVIISYMLPDNFTSISEQNKTFLTLEELDNAVDMFPTPKFNKSHEFIHLHFLETLRTVMSQAEGGKFDLNKDTVAVLVPAADISMWANSDLKDALKDPGVNPQFIPYLEKALHGPWQSLDGKAFCVVSPVGLMPGQEPYYYIPEATKRLIKMSKRHPLTRRYNKVFFGIPKPSRRMTLIRL